MQHTLEWEYVPEYELLGLSSSFGSHRLGWSLNRAFGWALACEADVVVTHPKGAEETQHPAMRDNAKAFNPIKIMSCVERG